MRRILAGLLVLAACGGGKKSSDGKPAGDGSGLPGDGSNQNNIDANLTCSGVSTTVPNMHEQLVVGGLALPLYVAQPPGSTDLYVVEKAGKIRIVRSGAVLSTPFLDVTSEIYVPFQDSETGLLGLAFASDYGTSGRYFVYMTPGGGSGPRIAVREYHRSTGNADVSDASPVAELITIPTSAGNDLGGTIQFGPDGYLWLATGDAASSPSAAPDTTSRLGKVLRVDVNNPSTPPPNGLGGSADGYVWDYGLRNPYRFSFDHATNQLYLADAGDTLYEEVEVEAQGMGHKDYGWDRYEGAGCKNGSSSCGAVGTAPTYSRAHESGYSVIIGGNVYRGSALPQLQGRYIFAIHSTAGSVLSFVYCDGTVKSVVDLTPHFTDTASITGFGEDRAGELYYTTLSGKLYQIVPN